jgi:predicted ester cyclase
MATTATTTSRDGFHQTAAAQRADELVRAFFGAVSAADDAQIDELVARSFLSYDLHGTRSRTGLKRYHSELRQSFSELRFEVHENVGVLVEGDLVALRTIITGTHAGDYAGVAPTGTQIQTSASHFFRVRDDQLVEHWQVVDTYRILAAIGAIPGVASVFQEQVLGVQPSPDGLFEERLGTEFGYPAGRPITSEESRAVVRRLYDGIIATGRAEDVDILPRATSRTRAGRPTVPRRGSQRSGSAAARCPMAARSRRAMVAEHNRVALRSVWDGPSPRPAELRTSRRPTSSASRTDSSPSTGSPSTGWRLPVLRAALDQVNDE